MVFSEPHTSSSSSSRPPTSSSSSARPPAATTASRPTSTLTSSLNNASNNNNASSKPVAIATIATSATSAAVPIPSPSSGGHSRNSSFSAGGAVPLAVSIPRQRSFSSSFSLAAGGLPVSAGAPSPRTFTGSSMISNPGSFPGSANPFAMGAFTPLSPTSSSPPGGSNSASVSQSVPVLHRRFSSSFNQLNQIVSPSAQSTERGRRTSMFGGSSPPTSISIQTASSNSTHTDVNNNSVSSMGSGLFRKFSTSRPVSTTSAVASTPAGSAAPAGHPFDRNDAGPTVVVSPQPSSNQQQYSSMLPPPGTQDDGRHLTTAVDKLKTSYDKTSRSSSPMRSMILNGQMLD
ncbi:hypothetical protein BGZ96_000768 [Linnemannia gamsii]|uniref:Uncharacterized protein n=1 Tax=Linnemannia gamsii TaxID=64522 RepID=A0ABQ7KAJ0_9FUNG|nr:hypothetical protein BGZ96_000768 [Linnemannia gamsii]